MTHTSRMTLRRGGVLVAAALLFMAVASAGPVAAAGTAGEAAADSLVSLYDEVAQYAPEDFTAGSWASFSSAKSAAASVIQRDGRDSAGRAAAAEKLQGAADGLVMVGGLKSLVADYKTRVAAKYTGGSWAPFAKALDRAASVAADGSATAPEVAAAKTELMSAADSLVSAEAGTFQTITNNKFWNDTSGNPIYSQGGGVFKFGDTYYWYGVHYLGAESYRANPTQKYDNQVSFQSIPVYSSQDLVNWKFENRVATRSTSLGRLGGNMGNAGWIGRLGVSYNENTGKYVLLVQMWHPTHDHGVLFLQGDSPTSNFTFGNFQVQVTNSPTTGTGDQTVFTDDNGQDYLIFSNREGRSRGFVSRIRASDSLYVEPGVQIRSGAGREGNAMFKLDGKYYHAASDLHGWNTSVNYVNESTSSNIQGSYSGEYVLAGTEMDYSHVTQTGFFVTVKGTVQNTVIYAGDRWADFAWNGIGYNQWVPITRTGTARPRFHSVSQWQFNATTGEWRVGPDNNYILNPDFQADRIIVSNLRGWTNSGGSVTNVNGGANGSRFALQVSNSGSTRQQITVPAGTYNLSSYARGSAGQIVVTDAGGNSRTLSIPSSSGWAQRRLTDIALPAGAVTVTVRASGSGGFIVDQLSLVKTSGNEPPPPGRYEAETAPAVCQGTIDSNHSGYSGSGFCNGDAAIGAYSQFTVDAPAAGTATVGIRYANGSTTARPANLIVNGSTVATASFEPTGAWSTWTTTTLTVPLNAGSNTIRLDPTTAAGLPNVDYLDLEVATGPDRFEAESPPTVCVGSIDTNWSGYSGSGFCNGDNAVGAYSQFTVSRSAAGAVTLGVRFANGTTSARAANLIVNGTTVATVSFEPTGAWSTWATKTLTVTLNAGSSTIRLDPTTAAGLPNVDYLDVG